MYWHFRHSIREFMAIALGAALASTACAGAAQNPAAESLGVGRGLEGCRFTNAEVGSDGRVRIARDLSRDPATHGDVTCDIDVPSSPASVSVTVLDPRIPVSQTDSPANRWPYVATDIVLQARQRRTDGTFTQWEPRNLLLGGDFADSNANGVPDSVQVLVGDAAGTDWSIIADIDSVGPPPAGFWLAPERIKTESNLLADDSNPASSRALHLGKQWEGGGMLASMTTALLAPDTGWTVSGWTRYDKPATPDAMARFHETDASGRTTTKYVMLGDDDFHAPVGTSEWRWRALSFTSRSDTTGLMLIPARLTASAGQMRASGFEIREGSVYDASAPLLFQADFARLEDWDISDPKTVRQVPLDGEAGSALEIQPAPGEVVAARHRNSFPVTPGTLYALSVAMANETSPHYDSTHDAWMSCYLEFLDEAGTVLDFAKAQVFRPRLDRPVAAATIAPRGAVRGRILLAAMHKTYSSKVLDGTMKGLFSALRVARSSHDASFEPRPPGRQEVLLRLEPGTAGIQIRTRLLTRDPNVHPSFLGLTVRPS